MLTRAGYRDWKHASGKQGLLEKHNNCHAHKQAMISWGEYIKNARKGTTIADRLDSTRRVQVQDNRHYLKTVAELFCFVPNKTSVSEGIMNPIHL